ncbi:abasic site processing protein HMCES isoform X4 [Gymnogyps californianus]|uniref:abasic site processing protein HMCES isoform X4 n=1 Tax=Gymnogyps californianus TaxID=33616 RepID=UPI0021C9EBFD|nr:abasic site processing protein HMCES isoform X4 [Gymnogyps californianus]
MCGRTACSLGADNLRRACAYRDRRGRRRQPEWIQAERYRPSYNKGPQSSGPVLLSRRHLQQGALLKGKRCVVLADGFYEWQQHSGGKQPYFIYFPQTKDAAEGKEGDEEWRGWRLLTMAGIFDCWEPPAGGEMLYTYTIITVDASKDVSFIHHRMPAILDGDEAIRKWLDFAEVPVQEAVKLIQPTENIIFHPVSTFVNSVRNNAPECLTPIELGANKEVKATPSSKVMLSWLKNSQEGSPQKKENDLPRWTSQFIHSPSPKKTSADILQQWLGKEGEPAAKKCKA